MSERSIAVAEKPAATLLSPAQGGILQRKCDCGQHAMGGECEECKKGHSQLALARRVRSTASRNAFPVVQVSRQRTLLVGGPDDPMEAEADRVADRVIGSAGSKDISLATSPLVQRQEAGPDLDQEAGQSDEDGFAADELEEGVGDESGRPKLSPRAGTQRGKHQIQVPDNPGTPLGKSVRAFMQSRFARDFSGVRIHTDAAAARSADELQAQAYTVGQDIYFSANHFAPNTKEGRHLLAHELTHVVQQTKSTALSVQRAPRKPRKAKDAPPGSGQHRKRLDKPKPKCATGDCNGGCAAPVESAIRHPSCGNETCSTGAAANSSNFIRHLDVDLSTQMVVAELGTATATTSTTSFLSSPRPGTTPPGSHRIGRKCGPCHTNMHAHGMAWFTGFANDLEFGFHNSQRVAKGVQSLGCVRVAPCDRAKWIHDNTTSGVTTVCVHSGDHCKPKTRKRKGRGRAGGGGGTAVPAEPAPQNPNGSPLISDVEPGLMGSEETAEDQVV